jgi:hypothetical protein
MRRETSEVISRFLLYGLAIEVSKISWVLGRELAGLAP